MNFYILMIIDEIKNKYKQKKINKIGGVMTHNQGVLGSSPSGTTITKSKKKKTPESR